MAEPPVPPQSPEAEPGSSLTPVDIHVDLAPGERIQLTIEADPGAQGIRITRQEVVATQTDDLSSSAPAASRLTSFRSRLRSALTRPVKFNPTTLFWFGMAVYLVVRIIGLGTFPATFSCDEAVNPLLADKLLHSGLKDPFGEFLPTFFLNDGQYVLGTSVYLQTIPVLLFGKSVWAARAAVALLTLLAAFWSGRMLRDSFKLSLWWLAPLGLAVVPAWFLLSRTVFEYALLVTFYSGFLHFYVRYRLHNPRDLYWALLCGALAFYSYTPGQVVMVATGLLLFFFDLRYHWQQRRVALIGLGLLVVLTLPLVRFWILHPGEYLARLQMYSTYWIEPLTGLQKAGRYLENYLSGLNPLYWFFPNDADPVRYRMAGYGHLATLMLPFSIAGIVLAARSWREPHIRTLLIALLAAPTGAAVVGLTVQRALTIILPLTVFALLALDAGLAALQRRRAFSQAAAGWALTLLLSITSLGMLTDALTRGPAWFNDYGLDGLQWGAPQVYKTAREYHQQHPERKIIISPNWTFQGTTLREFFVPDIPQVEIGAVDAYLEDYTPAIEEWAFVFTPADLEKVQASGRFSQINDEQTIPYPKGEAGFHLVTLQYRPDILDFLAAERAARSQPIAGQVEIDDEFVDALHSPLDMGSLADLFDGNLETVVRTSSANPLVVELLFPTPRPMSGITARVGSETVRLTVLVYPENEGKPQAFVQEAGEVSGYKDVAVSFGESLTVTRLRVELLDLYAPEVSHVHLWELSLEE